MIDLKNMKKKDEIETGINTQGTKPMKWNIRSTLNLHRGNRQVYHPSFVVHQDSCSSFDFYVFVDSGHSHFLYAALKP